MSKTVRLLSYPELLTKGYEINSRGELQTNNGWVIIEPQEFSCLGQMGEIVEVKVSANGEYYCEVLMSSGERVDYILQDCLEFDDSDSSLSSVFAGQNQVESEVTPTDITVTSDDISEAMYHLVEIAEIGGFEIVVNCSLIKDGRKIDMSYKRGNDVA